MTAAVVAPSTPAKSPTLKGHARQQRRVGPLLRGTEQCARSPLGAQAYNAESEVLVPISSTKTNRLGSSSFAIVTFQAHLKNSSRSSAPIVRFFERSHPLHTAPYGGVAKGRVSYVLHEAASLRDGGAWALL